ncbi:paraquat-inducible protein A [Novosphingobium terrae]|uniref:paraquat-inducible protein A n=1 Tax=Novosphingobium terrae TaxID=2726189 RepID=UPI0019801486|nr:paraquat-inducible protein A [Novosphingobium terrae]
MEEAIAGHERGDQGGDRLTSCLDCGLQQRIPHGDEVACTQCGGTLKEGRGRSQRAALALSLAVLLLLIPGNFQTFLSTSILGISRHSHLASAARVMAQDSWPLLAGFIFLFAVLFPFVRFAALAAVLTMLELGRQVRWLGQLFRVATELQTWAMPDVFLLGLAIAYARLNSSITTHIGIGALCFIAAGILSLFLRAVLDEQGIWQRIYPDPLVPPSPDDITCYTCELVLPRDCERQHCPRCGSWVTRRLAESISRTVALTLAGLLLYIPANLYPLATLPIGGKPMQYTVFQGVIDLVDAKLWALAAIVFIASFLIPALKLAGLSWCVASVLRRSNKRLVAKTRVYRIVDEIGRWSMVDPFVIGCFAPVMGYNALIYGRAGPAALPFTLVVVLTIIGAKCFDPRLMWDAARHTPETKT